MLEARLRAAEKRLRPQKGGGPLRVWFVYGHTEKELSGEIEKIKSGKVRHEDGGLYSPGDSNMFIEVIDTHA